MPDRAFLSTVLIIHAAARRLDMLCLLQRLGTVLSPMQIEPGARLGASAAQADLHADWESCLLLTANAKDFTRNFTNQIK